MVPPFLIPPEDDSATSWRMARALGMPVVIIVMVIMGMVLYGDSTVFERTIFPMLISVVVVALVIGTILKVATRQTGPTSQIEKLKREGTDLYTLIDRLVDDLDDDEAVYLRQRLDERDSRLERHDLTEQIEDQLNRRAR